jgi:hypothetical protein
MTIFLSAGALAELNEAQRQLDRHTGLSSDGRCPVCDLEGPCPLRRAALRVFGRYAQLPRRRPGATGPQLVGLRRLGDRAAWFGREADAAPADVGAALPAHADVL